MSNKLNAALAELPIHDPPASRPRRSPSRLADEGVGLSQTLGASTESPVTAHSAYDLMFEEIAPIRWIVEGLIPEGTILLAGKPKSGKSWLAMNLMLSAVLGHRFLKKDVVTASALYLALEDNKRRMQSRLKILMQPYGDQFEPLKSFEWRCEWPAGALGAQALSTYLSANPMVKIVAIDVLQRIRDKPKDGGRSNGYADDYNAVMEWKRVADKHRVTLILVHHSRKAEAEDVFDEVSGTLGINGAVDQLIVLRRVATEKNQATAHFRGRDLPEDQELGIELRDGWWELVGSAGEIAANDARRTILEVLAEEGRPMTVGELLKATGKKSRPSLSSLLRRMLDDRALVMNGRAYALPSYQ